MFIRKLKSKFLINFTHFRALCRRYVSLIFSDKMSFLTLVFQAPIMLLVIYLACQKKFDYWNANTNMFVISAICVVMATLNSYREICKERDILIRETNAGLDSTSYILSKVVVQGVICLFQALILVIGTAYILPFNISGFISYLQYFLMMFLILISSTCIGLFISATLKSSDTAILPVLFIIIAQIVLSGAILDLPKNLEFLSMLAVTRWGLGGFSHIFHFDDLANAGPIPIKLKPIYETSMASNVLVLLGISIVCIILSIIAVKRMRKRKK